MTQSAPPLGRRAWLGVDLSRAERGALVNEVTPGAPAQTAGIARGDVIVRVRDEAIAGPDDVLRALRSTSGEQRLEIAVERGARSLAVSVRARAMPLEQLSRGEIALDEVATARGRLRALLSLPVGNGPFPAVYLLQGAGWSSFEYPLDAGAPWRRIVDALTAAGFVTYRVERSGVGDSEGPACTELDWHDELAASLAGAERLIGLPVVEQEEVHVFGHSLGGMVAPLLADRIDFRSIAVFGSSARRFSECTRGSSRRYWERQQVLDVEERVARLRELQGLVYERGLSPAEAFRLRPGLAAVGADWFVGERAYGRVLAFFRQLENAELAQAWRRARCPVLALHGALDWVTERAEAEEISDLVGSLGRARTLDETAHDFCMPAGGVSAALLEALLDWLIEHA
jgi:uncharacterized protein